MRLSLPIAPNGQKRLPLADTTREIDGCRPIYAVWEVTLRCDLACNHCGSRAGRAREGELDTKGALDLVEQMAELGVREVTLIGGEAYLREDWTEIVRAIVAAGMACAMTTGGRGLTPERARAGKAAGLENVSVSIDGLRGTHDALRALEQRGASDAAFVALRNLRDAGLRVSANTQVSRPSLRELPQLFEHLLAAGIHAWQVQLTVAMGRAADEPSVLIEPYRVLELMPMLGRLMPLAERAGVRIWPGNNVGYFGPFESILRGGLPRGHMQACGAGRTTLGIESTGNIKGCPSLPTTEYVGANIREQRLRDIWERAAPLRFMRDRTADDLWGLCRTCYYADECLGGCNWTSNALFGRTGNNPLCHHRALELLREGKRERIVQSHAAPGTPFDHGLFELIVEDWPEAELIRAREVAAGTREWLD